MFEQISTCSNAKEIWEKLKEDYSTPNVEESKAKVEDSLCLMAKEDEIKVIPKLPLSFNSDDFDCNDYDDHDDMEDDYESLYNDFNNLASKYLNLKKKVKELTSELEKIQIDFQNVFDDKNRIHVEFEHMKCDYIVLKVDLESKNMVLQKTIDDLLDEASKNSNIEHNINACTKRMNHAHNAQCYLCGKRGHLSYDCYHNERKPPKTQIGLGA